MSCHKRTQETRCCSLINRILLLLTEKHSIIYLVRQSPTGSSCLPLPESSCEQQERSKSIYRNIFGISTRKVYPQNTLLYFSVCSYHTFSPLSRHQDETVSFLRTILSFLHFSKIRKPSPT